MYAQRLSVAREHRGAAECFGELWKVFELIEQPGIVFGEELGCWNIPVRIEPIIEAHIDAVTAAYDASEYPSAVLSVIRLVRPWSDAKRYYAHIKTRASVEKLSQLRMVLKAEKLNLSELMT